MRYLCRRKWCFVPLILLALAGFSLVTMLLWNGLLPQLFHFPVITFWQATGLLILTRLLFSGCGHHGNLHHNHMHDKWMKMTPEERDKFRENLRFHRKSLMKGCCDDFKEESTGNVQA